MNSVPSGEWKFYENLITSFMLVRNYKSPGLGFFDNNLVMCSTQTNVYFIQINKIEVSICSVIITYNQFYINQKKIQHYL